MLKLSAHSWVCYEPYELLFSWLENRSSRFSSFRMIRSVCYKQFQTILLKDPVQMKDSNVSGLQDKCYIV